MLLSNMERIASVKKNDDGRYSIQYDIVVSILYLFAKLGNVCSEARL